MTNGILMGFYNGLMGFYSASMGYENWMYPLVMTNIAIENGPVEIVSLSHE